jgi:ATP-dependent DNA ligase
MTRFAEFAALGRRLERTRGRLEAGHEGVMAKDPASAYQPGGPGRAKGVV